MIREAIFALGVVLVGSADYDPRVLVIEWQDGAVDRIPATNQQTCNAAVAAVAHGLWTPDASRVMLSIGCVPGNLFPPDEGKIRGRK